MPTVIQIQNMAAAFVVVGTVAAVLFGIAVTVDWIITSGRSGLVSDKERGRR